MLAGNCDFWSCALHFKLHVQFGTVFFCETSRNGTSMCTTVLCNLQQFVFMRQVAWKIIACNRAFSLSLRFGHCSMPTIFACIFDVIVHTCIVFLKMQLREKIWIHSSLFFNLSVSWWKRLQNQQKTSHMNTHYIQTSHLSVITLKLYINPHKMDTRLIIFTCSLGICYSQRTRSVPPHTAWFSSLLDFSIHSLFSNFHISFSCAIKNAELPEQSKDSQWMISSAKFQR